MKKPQHKHIGAITFNMGDGNPGGGTGLLISPNIVLTAAHNTFNIRSKKCYDDFLFYPGVYGEMDPKKAYEIEDVFVPWKFMNQPIGQSLTKYDFALLKLS